MANAIKKISVQRGYDVTRYALNCFGGAGGQHACLVADALGMTEVLIHPFSSLLSAYGMGLADIRATRQQAIEENLGAKALAAHQARGRPARQGRQGRGRRPGRARGQDQGDRARPHPLRRHRHAAGGRSRHARQDEIGLREGAQGAVRLHRPQASSWWSRRSRSKRSAAAPSSASASTRPRGRSSPPRPARTQVLLRTANGTRPRSTPASSFRPATRSRAPPSSSSRTRPSCSRTAGAPRSPPRTISCSSASSRCKRTKAVGTKADPIMLEVFNNLFMSIAEQMGVSLQNTAYSVNIKERLDFSCAVFSADGSLVANAPHMPVHLGSMDRAVETIIRENKGKIRPGDVYLINAPYNGGTHIPDLTVCTPVFDRAKKKMLFWVAIRGHHADIGGIAPGSMSPHRHLDRGGRHLHRQLQAGRSRQVPRSGAHTTCSPRRKYPARNPLQNVNDLKAQIAANEKGVQELHKMVALFGLQRRARLHEARAGQRRRKRAPRHRKAARQRVQLRGRPGQRRQGQDHGRQEEARGDRRFHRHLAAAGHQLQRAGAGDPRRRALRVPRHGRRRHPDERRLPAPDQHHHPRQLDAAAALSGGGRRRQRRGVADGHRHAVRRARRDGRRARHHEQRQLRQRHVSVLRDDLLGLAGRARAFPAPTPCTPT